MNHSRMSRLGVLELHLEVSLNDLTIGLYTEAVNVCADFFDVHT